jgi:hypothetical protein
MIAWRDSQHDVFVDRDPVDRRAVEYDGDVRPAADEPPLSDDDDLRRLLWVG